MPAVAHTCSGLLPSSSPSGMHASDTWLTSGWRYVQAAATLGGPAGAVSDVSGVCSAAGSQAGRSVKLCLLRLDEDATANVWMRLPVLPASTQTEKGGRRLLERTGTCFSTPRVLVSDLCRHGQPTHGREIYLHCAREHGSCAECERASEQQHKGVAWCPEKRAVFVGVQPCAACAACFQRGVESQRQLGCRA